jgi:hypothetical protein
MPTKCDKCNKPSYCIYVTCEHEKLCDKCYDKNRPECTFELEDLDYREGSV